MGFLRVISDHLDAVFELPDKPRKLGRGSDCDIQIPHKSVSRHHCIITQSNGQLRIEDLGSTYGTHVNGAQISDGQAVEGDKIRVGRIVLVYENELSHSSVRILRNQGESLPVAEPISPAPGRSSAAVQQAAPAPAPSPKPAPTAPAPVAQSAPPNVPQQEASAPKPDLPKFAPAAPAKPKAAQPKRPEPIKPVIGKKVGKPVPEPDDDEGNNTEDSGPPVGVFANIGGRKKGGKPKRHDYNKEAEGWEEKAAAMSTGEGGPDYAAEADEWEEVWGKQRHHKRFTFPGLGWLGSLLGVFGGLGLKARMMLVMAFMLVGAGGAKIGYDKATAHVLVPKKKIRTRPSTGNEKGDEVLDKAIESFQKAIPKELQGK